jgi:acetolactate synthase-1/2/3 large subunit
MKLTGAEIVIECLKEQEVDTIFGFPGGYVIHIYDCLHKNTDNIKHVRTSHEQGASHAADGYARATGKTGVCISTSGPGATNLVTGIATAYMDSVPIVAFTGQVPTGMLGKDAFQEVDITGITMPITKHNVIVKDIAKLADTIRDAFRIAKSGRPGPVLIDICKDVQIESFEYEKEKPKPAFKIEQGYTEQDKKEAIELIRNSKKPFIMAGGGVSIAKAHKELRKMAEKLNAPVVNTLMGLGSFPGEHENFLGMIGMHGSKAANVGMSECDLLIAVGCRFSDRVMVNPDKSIPNAKILHIDIDPAEINKNIKADIALTGDIKEIISSVTPKSGYDSDKNWQKRFTELRDMYSFKYKDNGKLKPQYILEKLYELTDGDALITTEVGQNQMWAAQYYKYKEPRQYISSGGLGTMGYGLGACIGAKTGRPDKKVINIAGDGSFRMNLNEIATAVEYNLPIIVAILNNCTLGMVRQWQTLFFDKRYSNTTIDRCTDFVKLAESFGAIGIRVTKPEEVEDALKEALASTDRPVIIDFVIDIDDKVYPMIPAGASVEELIDEE